MLRQTKISSTVGDGPKREFTITYLDDAPERAEAVSFFQCLERGLFPAMNLPDTIDELPLADAQQYLDDHPLHEQWSTLTIGHTDDVGDDDLARLEYIPEIDVLKITSSNITDDGLRHLKWLTRLEWLFISSAQITDDCLDHIIKLETLHAVDLQLAPNVTRGRYMAAMDRLPNLRKERYPPFSTTADAKD